jgi:pyrimidine operon attenuation protein/uracil phosphoribosyltransferase
MAAAPKRLAPPGAGVFHARTQVMAVDDIGRAVVRIAHEIAERNRGLDGVVLLGLQRGGVWLAQRIGAVLPTVDPAADVPVGSLDVVMYRDDIGLRPTVPSAASAVPRELTGTTVVVVDDVLFTGRTVRAALDAIADHGRPRAVQLAVMVDRGHRELPIRPDYVGKNLPTGQNETVEVTPEGVWIGERL